MQAGFSVLGALLHVVAIWYFWLPEDWRRRIEQRLSRPVSGPYPRGNSLWARLNRPIGWRDAS
jgi:hypothetical protein